MAYTVNYGSADDAGINGLTAGQMAADAQYSPYMVQDAYGTYGFDADAYAQGQATGTPTPVTAGFGMFGPQGAIAPGTDLTPADPNTMEGWGSYQPAPGVVQGGPQTSIYQVAQALGMTPVQLQQWNDSYKAAHGGQFVLDSGYSGPGAPLYQLLKEAGYSEEVAMQALMGDANAFNSWNQAQNDLNKGATWEEIAKGVVFGVTGAINPYAWTLGVANMAGQGAGVDPAIMAAINIAAGFTGAGAGQPGVLETVAGATGGTGGAFSTVLDAWNSLDPYTKAAITQGTPIAYKLAQGEELTASDLASIAGPIADAVAANGGSAPAAGPDTVYNDQWGEDFSWNTAPETFDTEGLFSKTSFANLSPEEQAATTEAVNSFLDTEGVTNITDPQLLAYRDAFAAGWRPDDFYNPTADLADGKVDVEAAAPAPVAPVAPEAQPGTMEGEESLADVYGGPAEESPSLGTLKPSQLLKLAASMFDLFGGEDVSGVNAVKRAEKVVNETYKSDEERRAAYLTYAQELLDFVPSVSEAYALDPAHASNAFGDQFIDPNTGEVRYTLNPGTQEYFDAVMQAANDAIDKVLGTDADKLSAEEFEKAVESLQGKRDKDLAALMRALYARGILGLVTYEGHEGVGTNPYFEQFQSQIEDENQALAKKSRYDAESYVTQLMNSAGGMLGKAVDVDENQLDALFRAGRGMEQGLEDKKRKNMGLYDVVAGPQGSMLARLSGMLPSDKLAQSVGAVDAAETERAAMIRRLLMENGDF